MENSMYKIKYLLFLSWDWEAWCLTVWGVIPPNPERNTAWNKGRKCFHCLGAPNNLIRPCSQVFFLVQKLMVNHFEIIFLVLSLCLAVWPRGIWWDTVGWLPGGSEQTGIHRRSRRPQARHPPGKGARASHHRHHFPGFRQCGKSLSLFPSCITLFLFRFIFLALHLFIVCSSHLVLERLDMPIPCRQRSNE